MSEIIQRLNDVFAGEDLTDDDMLNYTRAVSDKVRENGRVMTQIANDTREQAIWGISCKLLMTLSWTVVPLTRSNRCESLLVVKSNVRLQKLFMNSCGTLANGTSGKI